MHQLLHIGQIVQTISSNHPCRIEKFLGGGGQGEVYRATLDGQSLAVKWYFPQTVANDPRLQQRIENAVRSGPPTDRFLWPNELLVSNESSTFGYLMPLREERYKGIVDMMKRRINPSFYALATTGFELANSYYQLHAKGLCYRDISFGNVFFDPSTGEVRICDNDNVDENGAPGGICGTPRFMAPEIVRGEEQPSTQSDLFSLAVLLFYIFIVHHPLEGKREQAIHCMDLPAMLKLYGSNPLFIYDPLEDGNRPVPGVQDNAITYWRIYPQFLRDLFTRSFTDGIRAPQHGRVRESEWRQAMIRLRDSLMYCACGAENCYDADALKASGGKPGTCWHCGKALVLPPRIRIGKSIIMLNHDTRIFPHHVDDQRSYDFAQPVAEVTRHPQDPNVWGLKNLSTDRWVIGLPDGTVRDIEQGRSVTLAVGTKINFGAAEGEIRI